MGFLLLLFTTLFALQFAEARVLHQNSVHLDAVAVASSTPRGHVTNYKESESNPSSTSENSTQYVNKIAVEHLQKEATPGVASDSKAPESIKEVAPIEGNAEVLHEMLNSESSPGVGHMSLHGVEGNILSSSGNSPGVGHWQRSKTKYSSSPAGRTTPNNVLSSGPSPGVGNAHTSGVASSESDQLGTFNKLPSGSSPGVGHKVNNGYTEMSQGLESKKSAMIINKLPSGPSPGVGHSATNERNMMEKIRIDTESMKKSAMTMNILPSGSSPGVGNSATNGRNAMEKMRKGDEEGMGIQTFNRLPSGSSPGAGHAYTNAHQPEKLERASEDIRKGSDDSPIFEKLPGGPSPGGGHSYVQKSALTMRKTSNALRKASSSPSPGDRNSSKNKLKAAGRQKKKVEQTDWKIGCDGGGLDSYGTPTPPMFGVATAGSLGSLL